MSVWRCSLRTVNMNFCWVEDVVLVGGARNVILLKDIVGPCTMAGHRLHEASYPFLASLRVL
jgi:hypothetical protein